MFESSRGAETLAQLFGERSQLVVYHAMFDPETATPKTPYTKNAPARPVPFGWITPSAWFAHLAHIDVTLIAASRVPVEKLASYQQRMGWTFEWVSVGSGDFSRDHGVTLTAEEIANGQGEYNYARTSMSIAELPGISVFYKDPATNEVFHTYSTYSRGLDMLNVGYHYLDLVPKGRNEEATGNRPRWLRRRDEYTGVVTKACH